MKSNTNLSRTERQALAGEPRPDALPVLLEYVPTKGRLLSLPERDELVGWGHPAFANVLARWRVVHVAGRPGRFALLHWGRGESGGWFPGHIAAFHVTWASPLLAQRIARGEDVGTWLSREERLDDPMLAITHAQRLAAEATAKPRPKPASPRPSRPKGRRSKR